MSGEVGGLAIFLDYTFFAMKNIGIKRILSLWSLFTIKISYKASRQTENNQAKRVSTKEQTNRPGVYTEEKKYTNRHTHTMSKKKTNSQTEYVLLKSS